MPHITLLVHNIRSTHNVGAIFRTAEGFGVTEIVLSGYTPYPRLETGDPRLPHIAEKLTAQIHKTALGAEAMVPFRYIETIERWFEENQRTSQLPVIALEQSERSTMLPDFTPPEEFALLLGEEVHGIPPGLLPRIFEPGVTTGSGEHQGMGLFNVKWIIQQHHGTIEVESNEGVGTTIAVMLPVMNTEVSIGQAQNSGD